MIIIAAINSIGVDKPQMDPSPRKSSIQKHDVELDDLLKRKNQQYQDVRKLNEAVLMLVTIATSVLAPLLVVCTVVIICQR